MLQGTVPCLCNDDSPKAEVPLSSVPFLSCSSPRASLCSPPTLGPVVVFCRGAARAPARANSTDSHRKCKLMVFNSTLCKSRSSPNTSHSGHFGITAGFQERVTAPRTGSQARLASRTRGDAQSGVTEAHERWQRGQLRAQRPRTQPKPAATSGAVSGPALAGL